MMMASTWPDLADFALGFQRSPEGILRRPNPELSEHRDHRPLGERHRGPDRPSSDAGPAVRLDRRVGVRCSPAAPAAASAGSTAWTQALRPICRSSISELRSDRRARRSAAPSTALPAAAAPQPRSRTRLHAAACGTACRARSHRGARGCGPAQRPGQADRRAG